jgi:hypothetical protein
MRRLGTVAAAGLLTWAVALAPGLANAAISATPGAAPQLGTSGTDGTIEQIRQIVPCGTTMYAVGTFTQVKNPNSTAVITRNNAFAFAPNVKGVYQVTAWDPNVNGTVNSAACAPDGQIILAGNFTQVGTTAVRNLAKVDQNTGAVNTAFLWNLNPNNSNSPAGVLNHVEVVQGHLLVGGNFAPTKINATTSTPGYLASVDPTTGRPDSYRMPALSGTYKYSTMTSGPATKVFNMAVSPNGQSVIVTGVFTLVDGVRHEQLFRLDMGTTGATANGWSPAELYSQCATVEPFYAQDAAWSPDGTKVYVANTGYKLWDHSRTEKPRQGPCDSAIAYDATLTTEFTGHIWQNYTGCDSLYSIGADATTVYIAGHERWIDNPNACDALGSGGHAQPGLGELDVNTGHSVPGPSRGRGLGADDVVVTTGGVWIASDNQANTSTCGGKPGHMGLCFVPYQ